MRWRYGISSQVNFTSSSLLTLPQPEVVGESWGLLSDVSFVLTKGLEISLSSMMVLGAEMQLSEVS